MSNKLSGVADAVFLSHTSSSKSTASLWQGSPANISLSTEQSMPKSPYHHSVLLPLPGSQAETSAQTSLSAANAPPRPSRSQGLREISRVGSCIQKHEIRHFPGDINIIFPRAKQAPDLIIQLYRLTTLISIFLLLYSSNNFLV